MSSVKTTSFLLHNLHRDFSSAVLSLEGDSPGETDYILGRKGSTKSPGREFHACLLRQCATWDTVEQLQISQGYFRCLLSDFREDVLSSPSSAHSQACWCRQANYHLFKRLPCSPFPFAPKGTIHSEETGVLHKHSSWTKISFMYFLFTLQDLRAQWFTGSGPRVTPGLPSASTTAKLLSVLQRLLYRITISTTNKPGYLQSILLTSLTPVFSGRKT